jgi:hypothetical protein
VKGARSDIGGVKAGWREKPSAIQMDCVARYFEAYRSNYLKMESSRAVRSAFRRCQCVKLYINSNGAMGTYWYQTKTAVPVANGKMTYLVKCS